MSGGWFLVGQGQARRGYSVQFFDATERVGEVASCQATLVYFAVGGQGEAAQDQGVGLGQGGQVGHDGGQGGGRVGRGELGGQGFNDVFLVLAFDKPA
jgi:hypothetical protein